MALTTKPHTIRQIAARSGVVHLSRISSHLRWLRERGFAEQQGQGWVLTPMAVERLGLHQQQQREPSAIRLPHGTREAADDGGSSSRRSQTDDQQHAGAESDTVTPPLTAAVVASGDATHAPKRVARPLQGKRDAAGLTRKDRAYRALVENPDITVEEVLQMLGDVSPTTVRTWLAWWRRELREGRPFLKGRLKSDPDRAVTTIPKASRDYVPQRLASHVFSSPNADESRAARIPTARHLPVRQDRDASEHEYASTQSPSDVRVPDWVSRLLSSPAFERQKQLAGRALPSDKVIGQLLGLLEQSGGKLTSVALARGLCFPPMRLPGLLTKAQRMLNVDGYYILRRDDAADTLELNRQLLFKQFHLDE